MNKARWSRPMTVGVAAAGGGRRGTWPRPRPRVLTLATTTSRPSTIPGDRKAGGSKFEGIGLDERTGTFYVSETTGGEISRGNIRRRQGQALAGRRRHRRSVHRPRHHGRPVRSGLHRRRPQWESTTPARRICGSTPGRQVTGDSWTPESTNAFLNDVAIGPDGAAYFTNSNAPQVFRVAKDRTGWQVSTFVDATGTISTATGFNLGGIVATPDGRALVVAQGNVGALWRVDLRTKAVTPISRHRSRFDQRRRPGAEG